MRGAFDAWFFMAYTCWRCNTKGAYNRTPRCMKIFQHSGALTNESARYISYFTIPGTQSEVIKALERSGENFSMTSLILNWLRGLS